MHPHDSHQLEEQLAAALDEPTPPRVIVRWPDPIMNFLIAYDIADEKRLRQVAKAIERKARRVQKSVFVFTGSRKQLDGLITELVQQTDPSEDRIQAWPIRTSTKSLRVDVGNALPDTAMTLIITDQAYTLIEAVDDDGNQCIDDEPLYLD